MATMLDCTAFCQFMKKRNGLKSGHLNIIHFRLDIIELHTQTLYILEEVGPSGGMYWRKPAVVSISEMHWHFKSSEVRAEKKLAEHCLLQASGPILVNISMFSFGTLRFRRDDFGSKFWF